MSEKPLTLDDFARIAMREMGCDHWGRDNSHGFCLKHGGLWEPSGCPEAFRVARRFWAVHTREMQNA